MKSQYGSAKDITTRMILSHHAGIPDFIKDKFRPVQPYFTGVLDYVNDDYATFPPNTIFSYSNAGFSILGNLIENVTHSSYFDYIQKNILDPLAMHETGFVTDTVVPLSVRLGYSSTGEEHFEMPVYDAPAGCLYSTAYDMAKFIKANIDYGLYNKQRIFDSTTLIKMMEDQSRQIPLDFGQPYGLAWDIYYNDCGKSIHHGGGTLYHRAELSICPEAKIGIVMLSNSASGRPLLHADYDILNEAVRIKGLAAIPVPAIYKNDITGQNHFQMFSDFELRYSDDMLFLSAKFNMDFGIRQTIFIPLKIINDSLAKVYGYSRFSGQCVQFKKIGDTTAAMKFMGFECLPAKK